MTCFSSQRLLREWVALVAILAMVIAPLSIAVSRGLSAQERVNVAAGLTGLPICMPSDKSDGLPANSSVSCDHCLPAVGTPTLTAVLSETNLVFASVLSPLNSGPSALLSQVRLPPATGPPVLL